MFYELSCRLYVDIVFIVCTFQEIMHISLGKGNTVKCF